MRTSEKIIFCFSIILTILSVIAYMTKEPLLLFILVILALFGYWLSFGQLPDKADEAINKIIRRLFHCTLTDEEINRKISNIKPVLNSVSETIKAIDELPFYERDFFRCMEKAVKKAPDVDFSKVYPIISYDDWALLKNMDTGELMYFEDEVFEAVKINYILDSNMVGDKNLDEIAKKVPNLKYSHCGESDDLSACIWFSVQ